MTIPLSDAIRLGAMLLPQSAHYLDEQWDGTTHGLPTGCCALGGAALATGFNRARDLDVLKFVYDRWGTTLSLRVPHPVSGCHGDTVHYIINTLNSLYCYHWTRERIAEWVATIEKQETASDCLPAEERTVAHVE